MCRRVTVADKQGRFSLPDERIPQEQVLISPVNTDEDNRPPIFQAVRNLVRNKKAALVNPTLVEGEPADFLVTLENPFSVELEIENIELLYVTKYSSIRRSMR
jgi:hypothetical protein